MTIVAISDDDVAASQKFARQLGIAFPLLSDRDGAIARQYVGQDNQGNAVPGVVLIDRDGAIGFRQIGERKDDRLGARALLATIDRTWGTTAIAGEVDDGFLPVNRVQLRVDVGGGAIARDGLHGTATLGGAALIPIDPHVLIGAALRFEARGAADLDGRVILRLPLTERVSWLEFGGALGYTVADGRGWNAGASLGLQFAFDPGWAVQLEAAATWRDATDHAPQLGATIGIARLLRSR